MWSLNPFFIQIVTLIRREAGLTGNGAGGSGGQASRTRLWKVFVGEDSCPFAILAVSVPSALRACHLAGWTRIREDGTVSSAGAAESRAPVRSEQPTEEQSRILRVHKNALSLSQNRAAAKAPGKMPGLVCTVLWEWA